MLPRQMKAYYYKLIKEAVESEETILLNKYIDEVYRFAQIQVMKNILYVFFWLILGTVMYFGMGYAISKQEVVECNKLVSQSQAGYDNFYITQLEDAMCRSHGIIIDARVEK